jgi:hypothetical protein
MRGAVELPAVAIFTIVAGSLIIAFFVLVSSQQSSAGKTHVEQASLERFDSLLKSAAAAPETQNNITVIDETLLYVCDDAGMRIEYESHTQKPLHNMLVFAPHTLEGGHLRVYSKGVDVPFRMGNVLYVATDTYVINARTPLPEFPPNFVQSAQGAKRTVIDHDDLPPSPKNVVSIEDVPGQRYGTVHYYDATGAHTSVVYPNRELLHGAILSQDSQAYNCVLTQYLDHLAFVNSVEQRRAERLRDEASGSCAPLYQLAAFSTIATLSDQRGEELTLSEAEQLDQAQKEIAYVNDNLLRGDGCAIIY